jgi:hypothetical protein
MATLPVPGPDPPLSAQESPVVSSVLAATRAKAVDAATRFLAASEQDPEQVALEQRLRKNFEEKQAKIAQNAANAAIAARNAANRERRAALEKARANAAGSRAPYLYTEKIRNWLARKEAIAEAARIMGGKRTRKNRNRKNHKRKTHKRR